jgi:hypothetical protein
VPNAFYTGSDVFGVSLLFLSPGSVQAYCKLCRFVRPQISEVRKAIPDSAPNITYMQVLHYCIGIVTLGSHVVKAPNLSSHWAQKCLKPLLLNSNFLLLFLKLVITGSLASLRRIFTVHFYASRRSKGGKRSRYKFLFHYFSVHAIYVRVCF